MLTTSLLAACQSSSGDDALAPAARDDIAVTDEDTGIAIDLLKNDMGDAIRISSVSAPEHGTARVENSILHYLPSAGFSGKDSFSYSIEDVSGVQANAVVTVNIIAVNDPPSASEDRVDLGENQQVEINVLDNDYDPDGDPLVVTSVSSPSHGTASINVDNTMITYSPAKLFNGSDSFTYIVTDSSGGHATATVTLEITGKNDPPLAQDDFIAVQQGETAMLDLLVNDRDPEGDSLAIEVVHGPRQGRLDAAFIYTAPTDYNGYDEITYRITDPDGADSTATVLLTVYENAEPGAPVVQLPRTSLEANELAIIVNDNDPVSRAIAPYYAAKRGIPAANIIHITVPDTSSVISPDDFAPLLAQVEQALPEGIQAYALTWIKPYRVGCMSITSAFALGGYNDKYCNISGSGCGATEPVNYYNSESTRPYDEHGIRPAMVLAGVSEPDIRALINRGVAADNTFPPGTGYFVRTTDVQRSVRYADFKSAVSPRRHGVSLDLVYQDNSDGFGSNLIENQVDILFYFTGLATVAGIDTNSYRPGAVADHLTSAGGVLTSTNGQMSAVRWLEAGVTGSYGTVVEPCNHMAKFPKVSTLVPMYFRGNTLLEAYWKSVQWPGEGIFVGEPLAKPWGRSFLHYVNGNLTLRTTLLSPAKTYAILAADTLDGDFKPVMENITVDNYQLAEITVPDANRPIYKLVVDVPEIPQ